MFYKSSRFASWSPELSTQRNTPTPQLALRENNIYYKRVQIELACGRIPLTTLHKYAKFKLSEKLFNKVS